MTPNSSPELRSPVSRRTLLVALIGAPVMAAVVAACGDPSADPASTDPASTDPAVTDPAVSVPGSVPGSGAPSTGRYPTGADDLVLRLGYEGGFVPQGTMFVNMPTLLVTGDGRVLRPGAMTMQFPGPMVAPMGVRTITAAGIDALLDAAEAAGLLATPPDYQAELNVADVPDTVVTLRTVDETFVHRAYALGFGTDDQGNPVPEATPAREALYGFVQLVGDLESLVGADQLGPEEIFVATAYRLQAYPTTEADLAGIEPAPTFVDWPSATGVDFAAAAECAQLSAEAAGSVFTDADSNTFFRQAGVLYRLAVAEVLPGDTPC